MIYYSLICGLSQNQICRQLFMQFTSSDQSVREIEKKG